MSDSSTVKTELSDPTGLGRGPLTRWLPVLWQAEAEAPAAQGFPVPPGTTPRAFVLRIIRSSFALTIPGAVFAITWQVGEALVPVIAGTAIDRALATGDIPQLVLWLALLALDFLALSLGFRFASQLASRSAEIAQHRLRITLSRRVLHRSDGQRPDGGVVSMMTNDIMRTAATGLMIFPIGEAAGVVFIAVSLLLIHWPLGLIVLIGAPLVVWLMGLLSGRYARSSRQYQTLLADTVGQATDLVAGYRVIKGIRAEEEATRRYRNASQKTLKGAYRNMHVLGRFLAGSDILSGLFVALIAALTGWFAVHGDLTIGAFIAAVGLTQNLLPPLRMLAFNAVPATAAAVASAGRIIDAIHDDAVPARTPAEAVLPHDVTPSLEITLPSGETLRVEPGEFVGIHADDRLGMQIVDALLHPTRDDNSAQVIIGSASAAELSPAAYRTHVVVAPHHGTLFSGTASENLEAIGAAQQVWDSALQAASCADFLDTIGGVNAQIGEMGGRLSGGQRQRLALARALATEAPVLVLHNPTTAVDSVTEARVAEGIRKMRQGRSTVLFASSPSLLAVCDRVITLFDAKKEVTP